MTPFALLTARSLEEASAHLAAHAGAALLAGGTTLLDLMKLGVATPRVVIDISRIGHDGIDRTEDGWRIGALGRNDDVVRHPEIAVRLPLLTQAINLGASGQLRNMATVGGNLLQRTRCPYFRDIHSACNKREPGRGCDALDGANRGCAVLGTSAHCIAAHPGDMAVAVAALGARVRLHGAAGGRTVAFTDFNLEPGGTPDRETCMTPGEVILSLDVPDLPFGRRSTYRKVRDRASYEFALFSCALALDLDEGGTIRDARLALGGVGTKPWRAWEAEAALRGQQANAAAFERAADATLHGAVPRSQNGFKIDLARRVLVQMLAELTEMPA
jgi:xanthine dehydrogenase YagS FAD-binding subunit